MKSLQHSPKEDSEPPSPPQQSSHLSNMVSFGLSLGHSLLSHLDAKTRLGVSLMLGMAIFLWMPDSFHLDIRILATWISGVLCFLALVTLMMCISTPQKTRYRAQRQEAQHLAIFLLVVITSCTSIFAIELMQANNTNSSETAIYLEAILSLVAVVCSWFLTHTMFALHYATCFYRRDPSTETGYTGGLEFPGDELPDYWDFMYFAFTIGMTAQTSDITIPATTLRRFAIAHAIVSFFFYMVIIGSSVNTASGLM